MMPEVLGNPPSPRTALFWNGAAWQWALVGPGGRLIVRGEDQLHSFGGKVHFMTEAVISGADGYISSPSPPAGIIWVITTIVAYDFDTAVTVINMYLRDGAVLAGIHEERRAFVAGEWSNWHGHTYLETGDIIRVFFIGGLAADRVRVHLTGYWFTLET